jgi:hypothetical protein
MLAEDQKQLAVRKITVEFEEQDRSLLLEWASIKSEASLHGALHGSRTVLHMAEACREQIKVRAALAWNYFREVVEATAPEPNEETANQIKACVTEVVENATAQMKTNLASDATVKQIGGGAFSVSCRKEIDDAKRLALEHMTADVDLYFASVRTRRDDQPGTPITQIYNWGTIGAVQSGSGSSAKVSQQIEQSDREFILSALATVREALAAVDQARLPAVKEEVLDLTFEVEAEANKETPNWLKLKSGLSTIANVIKDVDTCAKAFEKLAALAALLGFSL